MKKVVIVDIDGTLCIVGDRARFLQQSPIDWDSFYKCCFDDKPIQELCCLVDDLDNSYYDIYFCTGRRECVRDKTIKWIRSNVLDLSKEWVNRRLLMRPENDKRNDIEVKPELIKKAGINLNRVAFVLEDDDNMVKKWKEMGLICLQVANNNF